MLEKLIEKKVCRYAELLGYVTYKFVSPARWAVPDRLFIPPNGKAFFVEFKRHGEKPTPAQEREHKRLRDHLMPVYVIDDIEYGKKMVDEGLSQ